MNNQVILGIGALTVIGVFFSSWGFTIFINVDRNAAFAGSLFMAIGVGTLFSVFLLYYHRTELAPPQEDELAPPQEDDEQVPQPPDAQQTRLPPR